MVYLLVLEEDAMTVRTAGEDRAITQREVERACVVEQVYWLDTTTDLKSLIGRMQGEDPETRVESPTVSQSSVEAMDGLLRYQNRLYIPGNNGLRQKLLKNLS
jgi:hypothetical protein